MDCAEFGDIVVCGNFADREAKRPEDWIDRPSKWWEPYPFDIREKIGRVTCSCKQVKVNFSPYYGADYYHDDKCNLMRQLEKRPQLTNLFVYEHLPAIVFYEGMTVPASDPVPLFVEYRRRCQSLSVRRVLQADTRQLSLL